MNIFCPHCKCKREFDDLDEGPDSYEDDISYTSYVCNTCQIYCNGWTDDWFEEGTRWQEVDYNLKPLFTSEQYDELEKQFNAIHSMRTVKN